MKNLEEFGMAVQKCGVDQCGCKSEFILGLCDGHLKSLDNRVRRSSTSFWAGMIIGVVLVGMLVALAFQMGAIK